MDKYKKFYGILLFITVAAFTIYIAVNTVVPKYNEYQESVAQVKKKEVKLKELKSKSKIVENKIKKIKDSISGSQKKIFFPQDADLGNDTLFFTLYNDLIEMIQSNQVKIKSINYEYNPDTDAFVRFGKDVYFVCDVNLEIISNFVNLGKLIQDIHQYPYYIKINEVSILPYKKDKTILLSTMKLRLYAHTLPEESKDN